MATEVSQQIRNSFKVPARSKSSPRRRRIAAATALSTPEVALAAPDPTRPEWVASYEELGRWLGFHRASFPRLRRAHADCPAPRANGDHSLAAWTAWLDSHPAVRARSEEPEPTRAALELERIREQARKLRIANDITEGRYVLRGDIARALSGLATGQRALLRQKLENEFPALLSGLDPGQRAELRKLGKELVDRICAESQRLADGWPVAAGPA